MESTEVFSLEVEIKREILAFTEHCIESFMIQSFRLRVSQCKEIELNNQFIRISTALLKNDGATTI